MTGAVAAQVLGAFLWQAQLAVGLAFWTPEWAVREARQRIARLRHRRPRLLHGERAAAPIALDTGLT